MRANEIRRAVIQLPAAAHQWDKLFMLVSQRDTETMVMGPESKWRLFDDICGAAALCEGSDLVVDCKAVRPEHYIKLWRGEFSAPMTLEQAAGKGILFSAELVVDPDKFEERDAKYYRERMEELRKQKTPHEHGNKMTFLFDMNDVEDIKLVYVHRPLHADKSKSPISATWSMPAAMNMDLAFGDLFGEVAA